ncbi:MAG: terminase large subunit [Muribaculaceae bacterium]|nr:terminase large subunit [Muribaculaceae bacterium]
MNYKEYAEKVISGEITACNNIKLACERFLRWFDKYEFRPEAVDRVINFISKLKHYTGAHNGKNFILLPYQVWIIANIFGFYYKGTDRRVVNYVYLELARKSGKTALVAAICLYMLVADGENGSEVELVANSAKQAKICFDMASNFLSSIDSKGKYFKRYRDKIKFDKTKSFLQVLSSDASGNDGYNSYCFCLDECHEQPDSRLWDVMVSSQGMRTNSLGIIITTAGFNKFGFCYSYRKTCLEILNGLIEDDSQFAAIFTLDDTDNYKDENVWVKANPSLGVTVRKEYLAQQVTKASNNISLEAGIKTKNFNCWVNSIDTWIAAEEILRCSKNISLNNFSGYNCFIGVDLAAVSDLTALAILIPLDDKLYFINRYYLPESCLTNNSNSEIYKDWKRKGELIITPGNVTDYDFVLKDILTLQNHNICIEKIFYDSYNATQWAIDATEKGLPLEPFSQALWNFNRPTKEFERLIKMDKVILDNNEVTRWCFANVSLKSDHNENIKPIKTSPQMKIDGVIAMIQALGGYLQEPRYNNIITVI